MTSPASLFHGAVRIAATLAAFTSMVAVASVFPVSAPAQGSESWPIKEFEVLNVEPAGEVAPFGAFVALLREVDIDLDNPLDLDLWKTVPLPDETKQAIENHLRESALLLEQWGFAEPALEPVVRTTGGRDAYRVFLVRDLEDAAGQYHPLHCYRGNETVILLDADDIMDASGLITPHGLSTVGHELFHAVQYATPFFGRSCGEEVGHWITEGQARAVGWDLVRALRTGVDVNSRGMALWEPRSYSKRLPVPLRKPGPGKDPAYETASFWRYLAEFQALRTPPGPEVNSFDYSYLAGMLDRPPAQRDCSTTEAACHSELRWLDLGVQRMFNLTLRQLYPLFIDAVAVYGEHRLSDSITQQDAWEESVFNRPSNDAPHGCEHVYLTPEPDRRRARDVIASFEPVAAECWSILVEGFESEVLVRVEVEAPPGATALSDLSAVVAGNPMNADTAVVHIDPKTQKPTAIWHAVLPLGHSRLFLLTNVARDPANTTRMRNLPVTFTALETNALVRVSGGDGSGGSGAGGGPPVGGPSAGFGATRWWFGVNTSDEIAAATPASQSLPPGNACRVQLTLVSDDVVGDEDVFVDLSGWVPAPLEPGAWPVADVLQSENRIGEFVADVGVPCELGGCVPSGPSEGHKYRMVGFQGDIEFTEVSRSHATGRFDITAGGDEPYAGLRLTGIYSVTLGGPAGAGKKSLRADHPCAPPPPGSKPGAKGGKPGGLPDDAPGDAPGDQPGESGDGDPASEGEGDVPAGAAGAPADPDPSAGADAPGEPGEAGDPDADGLPAGADPAAAGGAAGQSGLILSFPREGRSVLRSEPQTVGGTRSVSGVALVSESYDLTVALPLFGCTVDVGDVPAAEQLQLALAHQRWLQSGRTEQGLVLFDFTAAELRLDAAAGSVTLELEGDEGGVAIRGSAGSVVGLRAGRPNSIIGNVSDATLEVTRGDDTFRCEEPMDFAFTVAGTD